MARPLCSLLRQLASSDAIKAPLVEGGALELVAALLTAQGGSPAVLEQGLGLLTNMTLRYPEAAARVRWEAWVGRCRGLGPPAAAAAAWPATMPACWCQAGYVCCSWVHDQ